jgi:hypothetical protein
MVNLRRPSFHSPPHLPSTNAIAHVRVILPGEVDNDKVVSDQCTRIPSPAYGKPGSLIPRAHLPECSTQTSVH